METRTLLDAVGLGLSDQLLDDPRTLGAIPLLETGMMSQEVLQPAGTLVGSELPEILLGGRRLLIIVGEEFVGKLSSFVSHKTSLGWTVDVADTDTAGTTATEIRDYIRGRFANTATRPDALLLVGDTPHIPAFVGVTPGSVATDLYFTCMDDGDDWYPEFPVGRFSISSADELQWVIDKTIEYEMSPPEAWMNAFTFMAGDDAYGISEETHDWVIESYMNPLGFSSDRLYEHSYAATTSDVSAAFNEGRVMGVYMGHGSATFWSDGPAFSQSDVRNLAKEGAYPFIASFACLSGDYSVDECLMETWLRQPQKGAIAAWGGSGETYRHESSLLEKKLFAAIYDDNCTSFGDATLHAKELYLEYFGPGIRTHRLFETYNLLGDPTVEFPALANILRIEGTAGDDIVRLVRDGNDPSLLHVFINGETPAVTTPLSELKRIRVKAGSGDDTLIVDSSNGLITLPGGIYYDGGENDDQLQLIQTGSLVQLSDTLDMGSAAPDSQPWSELVGLDGSQQVDFENVEQISDFVPVDTFNVVGRYIEIPEGNTFGDTNFQVDQIVTDGGVITADNIEPIVFANKDQVVIDAQSFFILAMTTLTVTTPDGGTTTYTPGSTLDSGSLQVDDLLLIHYLNLNGEITVNDSGGTLIFNGTEVDDQFTVDATGKILISSAAEETRSAVNLGGQERLVVNGLGGNDNFRITSLSAGHITDLSFSNVIGGQGEDTLKLDGSGLILDLIEIPDDEISGIERIDITGNGPNTLLLDAQEVLNISNESNTLVVIGDGDDTIYIGLGWTFIGTEVIGIDIFDVFTQGEACLKFSLAIRSVTLPDFDGDGDVDGNDLDIWKEGFGTTNGAKLVDGDADGDGDVDGNDFLAWQLNFGNSTASGSAATSPVGLRGNEVNGNIFLSKGSTLQDFLYNSAANAIELVRNCISSGQSEPLLNASDWICWTAELSDNTARADSENFSGPDAAGCWIGLWRPGESIAPSGVQKVDNNG